MNEIKMRDTVRSVITGFTGTVTGFCKYLNGCEQWLVAPKVSEDGSAREALWIDVQHLEVVESWAGDALASTTEVGGPRSESPPTGAF